MQLVPHLRELKLLSSILPQIRDLGTGLTQLEVLWVPRCGLQVCSRSATTLQRRTAFLPTARAQEAVMEGCAG